MVNIRAHAFFIALMLQAAFLFPSQAIAESSRMIELRIEGARGQAFRGDCRFHSKHGQLKRQKIAGRSPYKVLFPAKTLSCNIEKLDINGFITVKVFRGNVEEIAQVNRYPFRWVTVTSSGPWGQPKGGTYAARPAYR